ncbi:hemicentin-1-like [Halichoeres trimaculatus]|uniref:hemicentin-1-like n=1 Tax=Halichoeres trimaculatus TaxID=147232 RepID=UPI003D9E0273
MFVLMWGALLFSMKDGSADTGASLEVRRFCKDEFCVSLSDGEIRAEAGLCVVIPCSFTTSESFTPRSIAWFKCEPSKPKCGSADVIFSRNSRKVQAGFRGRVTLLEPDINQNNCSIIINDLTASDSGSYQLRVISDRSDGFQYPLRANLSVKDLTQKPSLMVPPLTEGQQTTLSCTAPGLCSGSAPEITWRLRVGGQNESTITGIIETENLSAIAKRYSSTLTFTPSAEHHGTNVTCKVSFNNITSTEATVTLNVSYVKEVKVFVNTPVREGETLNLTCSVDSFPPSLLTWAKLSDQNIQNGEETDLQGTSTIQENQTETYLQQGIGEVTFSLSNVTAKDSGLYVCTAKHQNNTLMGEVEVQVRYLKTPVITGRTSPTTGKTLNLTCSVESFPPSHITWTFLGSDTELQNDTESSTLIITNVTAENSGRYICTAKHLNSTVAVYADVSVTYLKDPVIRGARAVKLGDTLNLTCSVDSFPPSVVTWTKLNFDKTLIKDTKTAKLIIPDMTAEDAGKYVCSASHQIINRTARTEVNVTVKPSVLNSSVCEVQSEVLTCACISQGFPLPTIEWPLLNKQTHYCLTTSMTNNTVNTSISLSAKDHNYTTVACVSKNEFGEMDVDPSLVNGGSYGQDRAEGGAGAGVEPREVEYSNINFDLLKRGRPIGAESSLKTTEYAEIKKAKTESNDGGMMEGNHEEERNDYMIETEEEQLEANSGSSAVKKTCQDRNYCISLREGVITAEAGLCVEIPCSFTTNSDFTTTNIVWFKCGTPDSDCQDKDIIYNSYDHSEEVESGFKGRVSLLEPNMTQRNCSIIINDLRKSDSGYYQLRVEGTTGSKSNRFLFTIKRSNVSVKDLTQKPTVMVPPLTEGQQTTLRCTAPGLCSGSAPEITWMWRGGGGGGGAGNIQTQNLSAFAHKHSSTLTFTPSAEHHGTNVTCQVSFNNSISTEKTETLNVNYLKDPVIRGEKTVQLGDALNLTCSVDSFPPSVVTWTKLNSDKTLIKDTKTAKLIIPDVTAEDVGKYVCSASHQIINRTAEVTVTVKPSISNGSVCEVQSEVLTCVCISQGFPLPTIEWPQLENQTNYSLTTSVSINTVNFVIASVKDQNYTSVGCVSSNEVGEVKAELEVIIKNVTKSESEKEDSCVSSHSSLNLIQKLLQQPEVIIAFLIGLLLSAVICCSVQKCHRKKQKSSQNVSAENLEMMDVDPAFVSGGKHGQNRTEGRADADAEQGEVEYSDINFDLLKRGRPIGAERGQEASEYAEIKKDKAEKVQDNDGEDGEVTEGNEEVERKDDVAEKEEEEFSSVREIRRKETMGSTLNHRNRMFFLLWLLWLTVRRSNAVKGKTQELLAEAGLCVVIPCSFTPDRDFTLESIVWYKCGKNCTDSNIILNNSDMIQLGFKGRVSFLEPDLSKGNCGFIINDLKKSDSGLYQLRVMNGSSEGFIFHRANITVTDLTQKPTVMVPPLMEGQTTTLSCTAPGLCSGSEPKITWTWKQSGKKPTPFKGNITSGRKISNLTFDLSAAHHGMEVTCEVSFTNETTTAETVILNVTYVGKPKITGQTDVTVGDPLNLNCSVNSFPPSVVTWSKPGSDKNLTSNTGSATLSISEVTSNHSGLYSCTAKHLNSTLKKRVKVTVGLFSKILNSSGCKSHSEFLTCTCFSKGFPLPTIEWPLLENQTGYSIIITVSNHTVNSTFVLPVERHSYTSVECVSSNKNGNVTEKLVIKPAEQEVEEGENMKLFRFITRLEMIVAFLVGALLSAIICCSVRKCHRNKQRSVDLAETLEMVTSQEDPLIADGHAVENGQAFDPEATAGTSDVAADKADGDYSNLDFSRIKGKTPAKTETTETEYAEIKKEKLRQDAEGKEEEEVMGKDEEKGECEGGEGVYSTVDDLMEKSESNIEA